MANDNSGFSYVSGFIAIVIGINILGEILGFLISGALLVGGAAIVWTIGSAIFEELLKYYQTPATIKDINQELEKVNNHQQLLSDKIDVLKSENTTFNNRKETEATTSTTIKLVEQQIQQRQQQISFFKTILSLHDKRIQKLTVFKQEYLLLRDLELSNQKHQVSSTQATQQYAELVNQIDLNIKYDYAEKMDAVVRNIEGGLNQQDTNAAINHLTEIVQQEIDSDQLYREAKVSNNGLQISNETERLILEDLYQLRLKAKNFNAV